MRSLASALLLIVAVVSGCSTNRDDSSPENFGVRITWPPDNSTTRVQAYVSRKSYTHPRLAADTIITARVHAHVPGGVLRARAITNEDSMVHVVQPGEDFEIPIWSGGYCGDTSGTTGEWYVTSVAVYARDSTVWISSAIHFNVFGVDTSHH